MVTVRDVERVLTLVELVQKHNDVLNELLRLDESVIFEEIDRAWAGVKEEE